MIRKLFITVLAALVIVTAGYMIVQAGISLIHI